MGTGRRTLAAAIALTLVAGCSATVTPGDPLIGTWRSDEYTATYPGPPSTARTVDEYTFAADGSMTIVTTRHYPVTSGDPYSGCTWVERHTGWVWTHTDAGSNVMVFVARPDGSSQLSVERTGCADPMQNHPPHDYQDDGGLFFWAGTTYSVTGDRLALASEVLGPGGTSPPPQWFTRER